MKLIYISNTRIPSERANTIQSMNMCEAFGRIVPDVVFLHPRRRDTRALRGVVDPFSYYGIKRTFKLRRLPCIDSGWLHRRCERLWFLLHSITFALACAWFLLPAGRRACVLTRDTVGFRILALARRVGLLRCRIFYEVHDFRRCMSLFLPGAEGAIAINPFLARRVRRASTVKVWISPSGVKLERFSVTDKLIARRWAGLSIHGRYVMYVGRFQTLGVEKGIEDMIAALPLCARQDVSMVFVGGPLHAITEYQAHARSVGLDTRRLIFHDWQRPELVPVYLGASDVVVIPYPRLRRYDYGISPLKLFEYMASGRPMVASNLASIRLYVEHGVNGLLFEPGDTRDLARQIDIALSRNGNQLARAARALAETYTWDRRAAGIVSFLLGREGTLDHPGSIAQQVI